MADMIMVRLRPRCLIRSNAFSGASNLKPETLRRFFARGPYVPVEVMLASGECLRIPSPEVIITDELLVAVDDKGSLEWVVLEAIAAVRYASSRSGRRGGSSGKGKKGRR
jgi:hypothetical protein